MTTHGDDEIRAALRAAHAADDPPPFRRVCAARPVRRTRLAWVAAGVLGAAAAAAAWLWAGRAPQRTPAPVVVELAASAYAMPRIDAPTDFLLSTPGAELLGSTPRFEVPELSAPPSGSTKGTP